MEAYVREQHEPTCDPVIVHSLMRVCRLMHDSVNALSVDDQVCSSSTDHLILTRLIEGNKD